MAAYAEITKDLTFTLDVEEEDATGISLSITPEAARNVAGRENLFSIGYQWEPASAEAWGDQWSDIESRGRLFAMTAPDGETTLQCCTGGDVVLWTVDGETHYACVTAAAEGESLTSAQDPDPLRRFAVPRWMGQRRTTKRSPGS